MMNTQSNVVQQETTLLLLMEEEQAPISVSAQGGQLRGVRERVDTVRVSERSTDTKGSCNWSGWGD